VDNENKIHRVSERVDPIQELLRPKFLVRFYSEGDVKGSIGVEVQILFKDDPGIMNNGFIFIVNCNLLY